MNNVNKADVFYAIGLGLIAAVIAGVFTGIIDALLYKTFSFSIHIIFIVGVYFIGSNIRRQYEQPHIIFHVIAIIMVLIGYLFNHTTNLTIRVGVSFDTFVFFAKLVFSPAYIFSIINPVTYFSSAYGAIDGFFVYLYFYLGYYYTK